MDEKPLLVIFPYEKIPTEDLQRLAARVIPPEMQREFGKSESRKRSYFAGRATLAYAFALREKAYFVAPNREFGFLELYDATARKINELSVNLSHTDSLAVAALAHSSVGIDVESKRRSADRVLSRVCTERELAWVSEETKILGTDIPTGIFLWSAKEAFSKAFGLGIKFGLQRFEIFPGESKKHILGRTDLKGPLHVNSPEILLQEFQDYLITICIDEKKASAGINRRVIGLSDFHLVG